jgi:hypothetical protein
VAPFAREVEFVRRIRSVAWIARPAFILLRFREDERVYKPFDLIEAFLERGQTVRIGKLSQLLGTVVSFARTGAENAHIRNELRPERPGPLDVSAV